MKETLKAGLTTTTRINVDESRTISFMGDEVRVYATPNLLYDIEMTCRDLLLEHIDAGQDSVGTHIDLSHLAATPLGLWVDLTVTVEAVEGRAVNFEFSACDPVEKVCLGKHSRFIVDVDKTVERLKGKIKAAGTA